MIGYIRKSASAAIAALALVLCFSGPASAGWLGFRNDLGYTISLSGLNANATVRVMPGETAWEWVDGGGAKSIKVANSRTPTVMLTTWTVTMPERDNVFCIVRPKQGSKDVIEVIRGAAKSPPK